MGGALGMLHANMFMMAVHSRDDAAAAASCEETGSCMTGMGKRPRSGRRGSPPINVTLHAAFLCTGRENGEFSAFRETALDRKW